MPKRRDALSNESKWVNIIVHFMLIAIKKTIYFLALHVFFASAEGREKIPNGINPIVRLSLSTEAVFIIVYYTHLLFECSRTSWCFIFFSFSNSYVMMHFFAKFKTSMAKHIYIIVSRYRFNGRHFAETLEISVNDKMKRGKPAKRNRHLYYCHWAHALLVCCTILDEKRFIQSFTFP